MKTNDRDLTLRRLARSLRDCLRLVETLIDEPPSQASDRRPSGARVPSLSIEQIEEAVVRYGSMNIAAEELGVNKTTLTARLRREFGRGSAGDQAAAGALLTRIIEKIGTEAVADRMGTEVEHVDRWAQWRRIPGSARRAIARLAEQLNLQL